MPQSDATNGKNIRVAVVAAGVGSPLGFGLGETLDSLRSAEDCVTPVTRFSVANCRCKTAGQVPDDRLLDRTTNGKRARGLHRASHMMICALGEALDQDRCANARIRWGEQFEPELAVI